MTVVNPLLLTTVQPCQREQQAGTDIQLQRFGAHAHQHGGANQPRRHRIGVPQHGDGTERADPQPQFSAQIEWMQRQRAQAGSLSVPRHLAGLIALAHQFLKETGIAGAVGKVATAAHTQGLVDRLFETVMGLLDIAVLVRHPRIVGRGLHRIMIHERTIARGEVFPPISIQVMDGRAQVVRPMLLGHAADLPEAGFDPVGQGLKTL